MGKVYWLNFFNILRFISIVKLFAFSNIVSLDCMLAYAWNYHTGKNLDQGQTSAAHAHDFALQFSNGQFCGCQIANIAVKTFEMDYSWTIMDYSWLFLESC